MGGNMFVLPVADWEMCGKKVLKIACKAKGAIAGF